MASIFTLESNNHEFSEKINLDELYDKKKKYDLQKLETFNKLLNRVHIRIKATSAQKTNEQFCWFIVPEIILGVPNYDQPACIAYLLNKLQTQNFYFIADYSGESHNRPDELSLSFLNKLNIIKFIKEIPDNYEIQFINKNIGGNKFRIYDIDNKTNYKTLSELDNEILNIVKK